MDSHITYGMAGGGPGAFIGVMHREAIRIDGRAKLAAGCFSSSAVKNKQAGEALEVDPSRVYGSFQDMAAKEAARADGIDFAVVVTPNDSHFDAVKALLESGIPVLCEKPLCHTVAQAEELERLSREKVVPFGVCYSYTGYVMAKVMREMVKEGKIGKVIGVNAEYPQEWLLDDLHPVPGQELKLSVWRKDPNVAGISNCVGDIGSHIENFVHYVTGLRIRRLLATMNRFSQPLDLNANIIVEYDNGANGAYWCSQVAAGTLNALAVRIYGDEGSLEWHQENPDFVVYTPRGEAPRTLTRANGYIKEKAGAFARLPTGHPEGLHIAFANIYREFISAVAARKAGEEADGFDYPRAKDGVMGVKFIHAAVRSAMNDAQWVVL